MIKHKKFAFIYIYIEKMYYFLYNLLLLFPLFAVHFSISTANELYQDDKILIEYVQQPTSFDQFYATLGEDENYDYIMGQMEQPLGIVYLLRLKWKCDKIGKKFTDQVEKNGCIMYRNYLDILYEYLFRMYAGIPAVKPKFYLDKTFAYSTLSETVESLSIIWNFYFNSEFGECKGHKLETFFIRYYQPKLFNEDELNYGTNLDNPKETFQDKIVQMGIEMKWDNGIKESYVKLIRPNLDKFLKEMFINWGKRYGYSKSLTQSALSEEMSYEIKRLLLKPFSNVLLEDITLIEYLKGPSHFEQICTKLDNESIAYKALRVEDKEELAQKYQSRLSLLYLMKLNWNCAKIVKRLKDVEKRLECERFGKYLNILYEYLFQIYAKTAVAELADLGPAVRPVFQKNETTIFENLPLSNIIDRLNNNAQKFFLVERPDETSEIIKRFNRIRSSYLYDLYLSNADKLVNYQANFGNQNKSLREGFDAKLKTMLKEARKEEKMYKKDNEVLSASPFYDHVKGDEDKVLIAFLKDESKLKQYCEDREDDMLPMFNDKLTENATVEQKTEFFTQKFEAHLGVVYLMRENWHCAQVSGEFKPEEQTKCQEYRKCLDILSKYLFTVGAEEDEDPVKAINSQLIIRKFEHFGTLIDVVRILNRLSAFFFDPEFRQKQNYKLENVLKNLKISMKNSAISIQNFEQMFESVTENEAQMFKDEKFDKKMEEMFNRAEENERKETEKLKSKKRKAEKKKSMEKEEMTEKIGLRKRKKGKKETMEKEEMKKGKTVIEEPMEEEEIKEKSAALADKFGTLLNSPEKSIEEEKMKSAGFYGKFDTLLNLQKMKNAALADKFGTLLNLQKMKNAALADKTGTLLNLQKMKSAALADKYGTLLNLQKMKSAIFADKFGTLLASPFYLRAPEIHPDY